MQARRAGIFVAPSAALRLRQTGGEQGRGIKTDKIVKPALAGDRSLFSGQPRLGGCLPHEFPINPS